MKKLIAGDMFCAGGPRRSRGQDKAGTPRRSGAGSRKIGEEEPSAKQKAQQKNERVQQGSSGKNSKGESARNS